ncbi:MAG: hypothetical protein R3F07_04690 [Opitutaceae bacterium]
MVEGKDSKSQQITLEKLLHVKRDERPEREFWDRFERELHQKQLSALVQAQPWYLRASRLLVRLARRSAPLTAAAAAVAAGYFVVGGPGFVAQAPLADTTNGRYETVRVRPVAAEAETAAVASLPELVVQLASYRTTEPEIQPAPIRAEARYAMDVMAKNDQPARYVTLSSPKTLFAADAPEGTYVVNALSTTRNAFHSSGTGGVVQF